MKCSFCGKELERGTQECPYCHCSIEAEVQVLRPEERDTFDGVTIEQDGNAEGGTRVEDMRTERRAYEQNNGGPQIRVHSFVIFQVKFLILVVFLQICAVLRLPAKGSLNRHRLFLTGSENSHCRRKQGSANIFLLP